MPLPFKTYLSTILLSLLILISGCGNPKPSTQKTKNCTIANETLPKWACDPRNSKSMRYMKKYSILVVGKGAKNQEAYEDAYARIKAKAKVFLEDELRSKSKYNIYSQEQKLTYLQRASYRIGYHVRVQKSWKSAKATHHRYLLSISYTDLRNLLAKEIAAKTYTKTYQNCFNTGRVSIKPSCSNRIKKFLDTVPTKDKKNIILEVHSDIGGEASSNLRISKARARNIARIVNYKEHRNSQTYYAGFGEKYPLLKQETKRANDLNRRIVLVVHDKNYKTDTKKFQKYVPTKKKIRTDPKVTHYSYTKTTYIKSKPPIRVPLPKKTYVKPPSKWKNTKSNTLSLPSGKSALSTPVIVKYTGEADTGWKVFGKKKIQNKFTTRCVDDTPSKMKRRSKKGKDINSFKHGMFGKPWYSDVDDYVMAITPVYLFENYTLTLKDPTFKVIKNDNVIKDLETTVNVYKGKKGILYRVFFEKNDSFQCMDLMIKHKSTEVSYGLVYYVQNKKLKQLEFTPKIH